MGEEGLKKKRFDRDFKISAVKMVTQEGHKASEVARSLGIHPTTSFITGKGSIAITGTRRFPAKAI